MIFDSIPNKSTILICGDSVTDCGRARPYGNSQTGLGNGYPFLLHNIITGTYPEKQLKIVNTGVSGETSRDVLKRWDRELDEIKPDYATLMIGINDVWRRYDSYLYPERKVLDDEYEDNLRKIISNAKAKTKGFMLISPFYIDLNKEDEMRRDVDNLNIILKKLAKEMDVYYCDVQKDIDDLLTKHHPCVYAADHVHPYPHTHYAIARSILNSIDFKF